MLRFIFLALSCISIVANAQLGSKDLSSTNPIFSHQYTFYNDDHYYFIDTTFNNLQWYHQFNHAGRDLFGYVRLGNMGAALNDLSLPRDHDFWRFYGLGAYQNYMNSSSTIPYYQVRSPLTEANYWMGYDRGQSFNIYHTQNINKNWNAMINFRRLNSLGFLINDRNEGSSFLVNTHYLNEEKGYRMYAYFLNERYNIKETGGITSDSLFEYRPRIDRTLIDVNLSAQVNSLRNVRTHKNQEVFIDQRIDFDKLLFKQKQTPVDSVSSDSTKVIGLSKKKTSSESGNILGIGHTFKYTRSSKVFHGYAEDDFFDNYYFNSDEYLDSTSYKSFDNTIYLEGQLEGKSKINLKAGIKHLTTNYSGNKYSFNTSNIGLTGSISTRISDVFFVEGSTDFIFSGNLLGSFGLGGTARLNLFERLALYGGYELSLKPTDFFNQYYISNNYIWENDFNFEGKGTATAGLEWQKNNRFELKNFTASNYVFFNEYSLPEQASEVINVIRAELRQNFIFFDFIHFDNRFYYNQVSSGAQYMPLPSLVSRNSLYFEFSLFGKALKVLTGGEMNYFSEFRSRLYNPALGDFYIDPNSQMIGGVPIVDVFANFELRKARIFVKLENASEGLFGYKYYGAPGYPLSDRRIRVGITWRFFN